MSDLARHDVHGPVATLRTELATWDAAKDEWKPDAKPTLIRFRPDGQVADGGPGVTYTYNDVGQLVETKFQDGKIDRTYDEKGRLIRTVRIDEKGNSSESEIFRYDSSGRKTRIQFVPKREDDVPYMYAIQGVEASIGGNGAATVTTVYDDHDQPAEVLVHDAAHQVLRRMTIERDGDGRVVKEEVRFVTDSPFPQAEKRFKDAPPEARESLRAALAAAFGSDNVFVSNTFTYDQKGRRICWTMRMGNLREERSTFRYDDHDNPIETVGEKNGGGTERTRFVYKYDTHGNWTEKETWPASEQDKDFHRWSVERRQITYYQ
jgi:YD repeat-containing protein